MRRRLRLATSALVFATAVISGSVLFWALLSPVEPSKVVSDLNAGSVDDDEQRWAPGSSDFGDSTDVVHNQTRLRRPTAHIAFQADGTVTGRPPRGTTLDDWAFARNVDFVYTWVNGSEEAYRRLRAQYGGPAAVGTSRDRDNGELRYSLRSLSKYLPWSQGRVFLVAPSGQRPSWLNVSHPRVQIIAQETLFPRTSDLPTFNSNAVEQFLWRIPGLSRWFVHMNDDYLFGRPVFPWHLFTPGGGSRLFFESAVIQGGRAEALQHEKRRRKIWLSSTFTTNGLLSETYGRSTRHYLKHAPYVYTTAAFQLFPPAWQTVLERTARHRFRHWSDLITPLLHHYFLIHEGGPEHGLPFEVVSAEEIRRNTGFLVLKDDTPAQEMLLQLLQRGRPPRFTALNDGFTKPTVGMLLQETLQAFLPDPCEFEVR